MAMKRKYPSRKFKRTVKRRFNMTRKSRAPRSLGRIMSFKRTVHVGSLSPSTASTSGFWQYFSHQFAQITNSAEYVALFDEYRINAVKCVLRPRFDNFTGNDTTDTTAPGVTTVGNTMVSIIKDPKSTLTPTGTYTLANYNSFLENGDVKVYMGNKPVTWYFKPQVERTVGGLSAASRIPSPWISTAQTTIPHYGTHVFFSDVNFTGVFNQAWDLFVTYYVQCRGSK